uniref:Uncharacterized protein n=1 Tax=Opuntia streptacantha TaxID=393608 RepID=A0A7C9A1V1_OPUST
MSKRLMDFRFGNFVTLVQARLKNLNLANFLKVAALSSEILLSRKSRCSKFVSTWREFKTRSVTGKPPKSNVDRFLSSERSLIPPAVTPVRERCSFSRCEMERRCLIPASVTFLHLERSSSFKLVIPASGQSAELLILWHSATLSERKYGNAPKYAIHSASTEFSPLRSTSSMLNLKTSSKEG